MKFMLTFKMFIRVLCSLFNSFYQSLYCYYLVIFLLNPFLNNLAKEKIIISILTKAVFVL